MFRIALFVTLIIGIAAKPYKPWNKLSDHDIQDTVMSGDTKWKMPINVEVEPPEDMDETDFDIDPKMKIWEEKEKQASVAEADRDDVHHPSVKNSPAEVEEQDLDAVYQKARAEVVRYLAPLTVEYKMKLQHVQLEPEDNAAHVRRHLKPEVDMDDVYHPDVQSLIPSYQDDNDAASLDWSSDRHYDKPEEDLDHIYHR
ncbi:uncharacterized protein si:ch211-217g15.3 [Corythoichthys intestinalis]|uniref:uncharacterized protein si:ch211-217g15.3 n=1 Tax=Corythoichthys intestinalis TaxID=161448 RepID=UPI0025A5488A|nr:uncharacterized protein si:ch211-217g15.3 [Corythoichthys intestinalis]